MKFINKKYLLPLVVIILTVVLVMVIMSNPPKSHRGKQPKTALMAVETQILVPQNYQVILNSFGTVKPRTQSALVAQVSGQIIAISKNFREGEFFHQGDILVELDQRDYAAELKVAQAGVLNAQQLLMEEKARSEQAKLDWQRLGNGKKASALVLRKPQLAAAKAQLLSAQAKLEKAQLALERTKIRAPYNGRILTKQVDVGQVVSPNSKLADIFATDTVEVRLPIYNSDLPYIELPEQYAEHEKNTSITVSDVSFYSDLAKNQHWQGKLVRTEGSINSNSQQLYVVAQIDNPFSQNIEQTSLHQMTLKIGQYLTARIKGKLLSDALVIPNTSIYQGSYVYVVKNGVLLRKDITIAWQNDSEALIKNGLNFGEQLVLTPLGQVSSGTAVTLMNGKTKRKTSAKHNKSQGEKSLKQRGKTL